MGRRSIPWEKALVVLTEHPSACYFRDRWGQWWRVYDGNRCPPAEGAQFRYFVDREGRRHRYALAPDEGRELTSRTLATQRTRAEYLPRLR